MKNRELFQRDPTAEKLLNDGQARIEDSLSDRERRTLRWELANFTCEGQYADGFLRILHSYLKNLGSTSQPAAWVSGFFGSGKSHLLKMIHHLWVNTELDDGATARSIVPHLPQEVEAALKELDTQGRRLGGIHAASGTLPAGGSGSVRLTVLGIVFRSRDFPEVYPQAKFCLFLRSNGFLDRVRTAVEKSGKTWFKELNNLYVSPVLHNAMVSVDAGYRDRSAVRELLRKQFPPCDDIPTAEFIRTIREVLGVDGKIPCTALLLDEVQLFIGDSSDRSSQVSEVAEALCKQLDSRVLLVGAGQTALSGTTSHLQRLRDRFVLPVELSDTDVETVTRRVLLAKRPDRIDAIRKSLDLHSGEIDRQLRGSAIGPRSEDHASLLEDYPLLPVRRRFWERVLRAVDTAGTASQLRSQLKILHEALLSIADAPVGTVVPADFMFDQLQPNLLQQGVLLRQIDETIRGFDRDKGDGRLSRRLCGLIFLIRRLHREDGIRATPEMLADLLVSDLGSEGATLRKDVPRVLQSLAEKGILLNVDGEYSLLTRESAEWDKEFRNRQARLNNSEVEIHGRRDTLLRNEVQESLRAIKLQQGASKEPRRLMLHFGDEPPAPGGQDIPVWVRDGWGTTEKAVLEEARRAGPEGASIFVFIPKVDSDDLRRRIIDHEAASSTIDFKGAPATTEGREAHDAMKTRMGVAAAIREQIVRDIIAGAKVLKGGGAELFGLTFDVKVREAAEHALERMFPRFKEGDHRQWSVAIERARRGDDSPLQAVDWPGASDQHPVSKEILREIGAGKEGRALRRHFGDAPFGWPQDAIDAALIVLHAGGHVQVRYKGAALPPGQLDHNKIAVSEFRTETVTLSVQDKIKIRGLFQEAGVASRPSDDLVAKAPDFLLSLSELATRAGGEPPLPERPKPPWLEELRSLVGNEQLAHLAQIGDKVRTDLTGWKAAGELAAGCLPLWSRLDALLRHAHAVPAAGDLLAQAEAIHSGRLLLDSADRVTPILKKLTDLMRGAVSDAHGRYERAWKSQMKRLEENDAWKRIGEPQRQAILAEAGVALVPPPAIGSDGELVVSLDAVPLPSWAEKTDALSQRCATAALLKDGPIVIG
ncbi:MAG: BREX system P-loop protein BrxC [Planctomycetes bacterium]|nr:BREX system P-loop protein BrxC [Planctomycetota bacterium]